MQNKIMNQQSSKEIGVICLMMKEIRLILIQMKLIQVKKVQT